MALTCKVISDPAELEALAPAWRELLGRSSSDEAMLGPTWLLTWWAVFGPLQGRRLRAALFYDGPRLVGLAPFLCRRHWYAPGIPFRRLEPLGAGEREAEAVCSDYLNVIAERGAEQAVAAALAAALAGGALGGWDELVVPLMDGDGVMPSLLRDELGRAGFRAEVVVTGAAPYIRLPQTWEEYLKGLAKKERYAIVRALRDFDQWAGGDQRLVRAASPAELEKGKQVLKALHQERWRAAGQAGRFGSARFNTFHDAVLPRLLAEGALELTWLAARGEPVAVLYNLVWNGKVYFYQSGRKIDLPKNIRPGIVLLAHTIRHAIERGRREFDFLNEVSLYKKQFAPGLRPVVQLRAARWSLREQARRLASWGKGWARALRRTWRKVGDRQAPPAGKP
jgi:CelD/BcsL family acetyltransferase involved in cellulose biosynthesis